MVDSRTRKCEGCEHHRCILEIQPQRYASDETQISLLMMRRADSKASVSDLFVLLVVVYFRVPEQRLLKGISSGTNIAIGIYIDLIAITPTEGFCAYVLI